jgi:hypothetical protein
MIGYAVVWVGVTTDIELFSDGVTMSNSTPKLLLAILLGVGAVVGGGYLWVSQNGGIDTYEPVDATVVHSELGSSDDGSYHAAITYEYTVDGQTYESSNVFPGPGSRSGNDPQGLVDDHPEGASVTAYYDPANPSAAFLVKERSVLFPVMLVGVGGLTVFVAGKELVERFAG